MDTVQELRKASREVVRGLGFLNTYSLTCDISHSECHALQEIEKNPGISLQELSDILYLEKSTTSRVVSSLVKKKWVEISDSKVDKRSIQAMLTSAGKERVKKVHEMANAQVQNALSLLSEEEQGTVVKGMQNYARALAQLKKNARFTIREVKKEDNAGVKSLIKTVMPEFGACGAGFAINDPEVENMFETYKNNKSAYFVVTDGKKILGGGGIAPLAGADKYTCELRKMYFLPELRGLGKGKELIELCLKTAKELGYKKCYLETLEKMHQAKGLYKKYGFKKLSAPKGSTGHFSCDAWFEKIL